MSTEAYRKRKREWAKIPSQRKYRREYMRKWRVKNREKANKQASESHKRNSYKHVESRRKYHLKVKYNLTLEAYDEMVLLQEEKCLICSKPFNELNKNPHIDHDHETGEIRGILCGSCNTKLGWYESFGESIQKYLKDDK